MANDFRMPSLGPDMVSGTLVEWRVKPGDVVKRGDVVALVETDKGVIDVEIFASGTIDRLLVEAGAHVPVGAVLAQLRDGEAAAPSPMPRPEAAPAAAAGVQTPAAKELVHATAPPVHREHQRVSPAARTRAHALGVDLAEVHGTGPNGVVTLQDVLRHAGEHTTAQVAAPTPPAAPDMRRVIAKAMSRSKREIPHYYLALTCDFSAARAWLAQHNATVSIEERLLPSALLLTVR